jgi:Uma2 family endonuclease
MTVAPLLADHAVSGPPQGQWTAAAWETLPDDGNRYEVIDGWLYMTTAPSFFHQWIVGALIEHLGIPVKAQGLGIWATAPIGVILSPTDAVQPDFVIVLAAHRDRIHSRRIWGAPDLVVEVLSPGNSTDEMDRKRIQYAQAGVGEYLVVEPAGRSVSVYSLTAARQYELPATYSEADTITLTTFPTLSLPVAQLFADAPDTEL